MIGHDWLTSKIKTQVVLKEVLKNNGASDMDITLSLVRLVARHGFHAKLGPT